MNIQSESSRVKFFTLDDLDHRVDERLFHPLHTPLTSGRREAGLDFNALIKLRGSYCLDRVSLKKKS